jgi:(p)ppGpp synthase/HD superfamily hydrolase
MAEAKAALIADVRPDDTSAEQASARIRSDQHFPKALQALEYAGRLHAAQRRSSDGAPFVLHLLEVGSLLYHADAPDHVVAAGFLHDVLEKTDADARQLRRRFGYTIADLVLALTEDARLPSYEERKAALLDQITAAGREALMVFTADNISKARDLYRERAWAAQQRTPTREQRLVDYQRSLRHLKQLLPESTLVSKLRTTLEHAIPDRAPSG